MMSFFPNLQCEIEERVVISGSDSDSDSAEMEEQAKLLGANEWQMVLFWE